MASYKDCPCCQERRIRATIALCDVCAAAGALRAKVARLTLERDEAVALLREAHMELATVGAISRRMRTCVEENRTEDRERRLLALGVEPAKDEQATGNLLQISLCDRAKP